jgi:hypothetical protein
VQIYSSADLQWCEIAGTPHEDMVFLGIPKQNASAENVVDEHHKG